MISDKQIESIRQKNNILDVISGYVQVKRTDGTYVCVCPFHREKVPSLFISAKKQRFYCFGCGAGGDVFSFVMKKEKISFDQALVMLAKRAGVPVPEIKTEKENSEKKEMLMKANRMAGQFYCLSLRNPSGRAGLDYFLQRGLTEETRKKFCLGFAPERNELLKSMKKQGFGEEILQEAGLISCNEEKGTYYDKFRNRVMFPLLDMNGNCIGFGGRVLDDSKPKYLNSQETDIFKKSEFLYGMHAALRRHQKQILVCEGYMDVIAMHQAGYTNAVASLGTSLTEQQCELISRVTGHVLLLYDSDEAGVKAALRAVPMLREHGLDVRYVSLEPHKDPDEFLKAEGKEAFEERLRRAENGFLYQTKSFERHYRLNDSKERGCFLDSVSELLLTVNDEEAKKAYMQTAAGN